MPKSPFLVPAACAFLLALCLSAANSSPAQAKPPRTIFRTDPVQYGPPKDICQGNEIPILYNISSFQQYWGTKAKKPNGTVRVTMHALSGSISPDGIAANFNETVRFFYKAGPLGEDKIAVDLSIGNFKTTAPVVAFTVKKCKYKLAIDGNAVISSSGFKENEFFLASGCVNVDDAKNVSGDIKTNVNFTIVGDTKAMECKLLPPQEASSTLTVSGTMKESIGQKIGSVFGSDDSGTPSFDLTISYQDITVFPNSKLTCSSKDGKVSTSMPYQRKVKFSPTESKLKTKLGLELGDIDDSDFSDGGKAHYKIIRVSDSMKCK
jgi:hypothetical protein